MAVNRDEFRSYLERTGAIQSLTQALMKLYEISEKPENPVPFICSAMSGGTNGSSTDLNAARNRIEELEQELNLLRSGETGPRLSIRSEQPRSRQPSVQVQARSSLRPEDGQTETLSQKSADQAISSPTDGSRRGSVQTYTKMIEEFHKLQENENCNSSLKRHLTPDIIEQLKDEETETYHSKLVDCIRSGLEVPFDPIGIYAADPACYTVFSKIFEPIIEELFPDFLSCGVHPGEEFGDPNSLQNSELDLEFISKSSISAYRSLDGFPFPTKMTEDDYMSIMNKVKECLESSEFNGTFYALAGMDTEVESQLRAENLLFEEPVFSAQIAGSSQFWPAGRAIYVNEDRTLLVWINSEEHLKFTSIQSDGDLVKMYQRLIDVAKFFNEHLQFVRHERLGWSTFSPAHLGNTLHVSVSLALEKLTSDEDKITEILNKYHLKMGDKETSGEKTIYNIENVRHLGCTEYNTIKEVIAGVAEIINSEKAL